MSKRYRWIYPALRPLDIGLCHARTPLGAGIRLFSGGGPYNHTWIATSDHGQIAATEMGGGGCRLRSLEHYRGPVDTVPLVIRWDGWASVELVEQWLAQLRRRRAEPRNYGWAAILQPWTWLTSGGPRDTDGTRGIYCSELVYLAYDRGCGIKIGEWEKLGSLNWKPKETFIPLTSCALRDKTKTKIINAVPAFDKIG
jgi:hypothetical protein